MIKLKHKKIYIISLLLFCVFSLSSCTFNKFSKSNKEKMNIIDLPEIENVEIVKKSKNFVSEALYIKGDENTFTSYAYEVYQYLNEKFYDTLGYEGALLNSAWGRGGINEYFNQTSSISDFIIEDDKMIMYRFVFSSDNELITVSSDNDLYSGSIVLSDSCVVSIVYFKNPQYVDDSIEYNMGVELGKPIGYYNHILVNSSKFSKFVYKYSHNPLNKEYHINLFLQDYDLSVMSIDEVLQFVHIYQMETTNEGILYCSDEFGDDNKDGRTDKQLRILYNENLEYIRHNIIDIEH